VDGLSWHGCQLGLSGNAIRRWAAICSGSTRPQASVAPQLARPGSVARRDRPGRAPRARREVSKGRVVLATVVRGGVPAQLPADRGGVAHQPAGDPPDAHPLDNGARRRFARAPITTGMGSSAPPQPNRLGPDHRPRRAIGTRFSCYLVLPARLDRAHPRFAAIAITGPQLLPAAVLFLDVPPRHPLPNRAVL